MKQKETLFSPHLPPLAERVRPQSLDEFIGQEHLTGKQKIISMLCEGKQLFSLIFWGPPGTGKTTKLIGQTRTKIYNEMYDHLSAKQENKELPFSIDFKRRDPLKEGEYIVEVYIDGFLAGSSKLGIEERSWLKSLADISI